MTKPGKYAVKVGQLIRRQYKDGTTYYEFNRKSEYSNRREFYQFIDDGIYNCDRFDDIDNVVAFFNGPTPARFERITTELLQQIQGEEECSEQ